MKFVENIEKVEIRKNTVNPFSNELFTEFAFIQRGSKKTVKRKVYDYKNKSFKYIDGIQDTTKIVIDDKTNKTRKKIKATKKVAVLSGKVYEVKEYEKPVFYNYESKATGKKKTENSKRENNLNQSKKKLRRLINANVNYDNFKQNVFLTLSFSDAKKGSDIKKCKYEFKNFIQRLKTYLGDKKYNLKYVYVTEIQHKRQEKYGDRVWHFHVIFFNLPFVKNDDLSKIWGNGFIKINSINNVDNVGSYVIKYMEKDSDDVENNSDLYGRSKGNLNAPVELKDEKIINQIEENIQNKLVYVNTLHTDYYDDIEYRQYNLARNDVKRIHNSYYKSIKELKEQAEFLQIKKKKHSLIVKFVNILKSIEK